MANTYSTHLKVVFVPEDLCEMSDAILRQNCFTVQHFHYRSKRIHNNLTGITLHEEEPTILDFTIRIDTPDCGRVFLAHMQEHEVYNYTFLFNATFSDTGRLADYDDAMVIQGCITDILEDFSSGEHEQMLMHVKLLLTSITFIGKEQNLVMTV